MMRSNGSSLSPRASFPPRKRDGRPLAVGVVFAAGNPAAVAGSSHSASAHYVPGQFPTGCAAWDQCATLAPLPNGDGVLTVTVFGNVNAATLPNFYLGSGQPVTVLRPKGVCHSRGKTAGITGEGEGEGYPLEFDTHCEVQIKPGQSVQLCEAGLSPIQSLEHPTDPEYDAGPYQYNFGANQIWPVGGMQKCPVKEISQKPKHKHPKH